MVDSASLETILSSLEGLAWSGRVYRVMLNDYPPDRENTQGARWNPPDTPAIYTCLEPAVCIAEVEYGLSRQSRPVKPGLRKTLYEIDVRLSNSVDLADVLPDLEDIGIGPEQLFADDMKVSQEVGRLVTWLDFDGLFVPSARREGRNLVIYPDRTDESYRFEVLGEDVLS
jgi:RES domain-containing protein